MVLRYKSDLGVFFRRDGWDLGGVVVKREGMARGRKTIRPLKSKDYSKHGWNRVNLSVDNRVESGDNTGEVM